MGSGGVVAQIANVPAGSYAITFELNFLTNATADATAQVDCVDPDNQAPTYTTVVVPGGTYSSTYFTEVRTLGTAASLTVSCLSFDAPLVIVRGRLSAVAVGAVHS